MVVVSVCSMSLSSATTDVRPLRLGKLRQNLRRSLQFIKAVTIFDQYLLVSIMRMEVKKRCHRCIMISL